MFSKKRNHDEAPVTNEDTYCSLRGMRQVSRTSPKQYDVHPGLDRVVVPVAWVRHGPAVRARQTLWDRDDGNSESVQAAILFRGSTNSLQPLRVGGLLHGIESNTNLLRAMHGNETNGSRDDSTVRSGSKIDSAR